MQQVSVPEFLTILQLRARETINEPHPLPAPLAPLFPIAIHGAELRFANDYPEVEFSRRSIIIHIPHQPDIVTTLEYLDRANRLESVDPAPPAGKAKISRGHAPGWRLDPIPDDIRIFMFNSGDDKPFPPDAIRCILAYAVQPLLEREIASQLDRHKVMTVSRSVTNADMMTKANLVNVLDAYESTILGGPGSDFLTLKVGLLEEPVHLNGLYQWSLEPHRVSISWSSWSSVVFIEQMIAELVAQGLRGFIQQDKTGGTRFRLGLAPDPETTRILSSPADGFAEMYGKSRLDVDFTGMDDSLRITALGLLFDLSVYKLAEANPFARFILKYCENFKYDVHLESFAASRFLTGLQTAVGAPDFAASKRAAVDDGGLKALMLDRRLLRTKGPLVSSFMAGNIAPFLPPSFDFSVPSRHGEPEAGGRKRKSRRSKSKSKRRSKSKSKRRSSSKSHRSRSKSRRSKRKA
jgi:hypothetical protein